jgi:hypothetical protein
MQAVSVPPVGLEPSQETLEKPQFSVRGGAESGAVGAENVPNDPRLAAIAEAWPTLPEPIKVGILAMIRAAG